MKITPIATSTGAPVASAPTPGAAAPADRIARATAIANGQTPAPKGQETPKAQAPAPDMRSIKMKTNATTFRDVPPQAPVPVAESNISDNSEQASPAPEEIKPISPQIAAIARKQRALAEKEREIQAREQALSQDQNTKTDSDFRSRLKSDPLSVLQEEGVTYDQLTESILSQQNEQTPAMLKLQAELEALKQSLENQTKQQAERDEVARQQVIFEIKKEAESLIAQNDDFELVREMGKVPEVLRLIEENFKVTGEVLETDEALRLVEEELLKDSLAFTKYKKVQSRLVPTEPQRQPQQLQNNQVRTMRTITSRDGATRPSSPRERALAAFYGRK